MKVRFLGHAAVLLTSQEDTTLLVDPYNPGGFGGKMAYAPIAYHADAVVCSHDHLDHCGLADLPNQPHLIEGEASFGPFRIRRHLAYHDEYGGARRGGSVDILEIECDGMRLVHLSDVGHSPTPQLVDVLGSPDMLMVPVGGFFTIGAAQAFEWVRRLGADQVVALHYKTSRCHLPIGPRDNFDAYVDHELDRRRDGSAHEQGSCVELNSSMISFDHSVVLLRPEC
jgi:L-ascorbate metabolism protein UlaG (beta-lactamase superfamily)